MSNYYSTLKNQFTPSSLSPVLFVNPYQNPYVNTVDNNGTRQRGNIIDSATATTGQALATAGTLASKPIYNGEGWYFEAGAQFTTGSNSDYNFIHDGSDFDIWATVFICPTASTTYFRGIISNNGLSANNRGFYLAVNSTANNRLEFRAGNGTSAFISLSANSAVTVNATNIVRVRRSGSNAKMFVNGVEVANQTISLSPGVGNSSDVLTVCSAGASSANLYLKDAVVFNRALTTDEAAKMNSRTFVSITPTPINVYIEYGDSNDAGRGANASIAPDLVGTIEGSFMETYNSSAPNASSWAGRLLLGTNQTMPSENPLTQHGSEMRFGKSMSALKEHCIIKWGRGSHSMFARGGANSPDFNISSSSGAYVDLTTKVLPIVLNDLVHSQRRTPVFRGITPIIGANDATFANQGNAWVRVATTATITRSNHGFSTGANIGIYNSNDLSAIPNGNYTITVLTVNTFTITVPNTGATSGTVSYSGAYNFKQNSYDTINGIIVYLTSTVRNQITAGTGYTVDKLRLYFPQTKATGINAEGLSQVQTAQSAMGTDFLTDNPARSANVLGSFSESTNALPLQDSVHYSTLGYDELGTMRFNYYEDFINE
jgi:hypothetical protein